MSRIFLSHSSQDNGAALALKQWLSEQRPELATDIFLDISDDTGLMPGERWKEALRRASDRCEAVICLLSQHWESSPECRTEYRTAENLGKQIVVARLEDLGDSDITSEWQRCDLFAEGPQTTIAVTDGPPTQFNTAALRRLRKALEGTGIGPENFAWPPTEDPHRAPYRGWEAFEDIDAAVFLGRDAAIVRGMDELRAMRHSAMRSVFVVLGPSGSGKSSFLRAGLIPRLQRDDRRFLTLGIMRPHRAALTGDYGLAAAIHSARAALRLDDRALGEIKTACLAGPVPVAELLAELRAAAAKRLADADQHGPAPTLVLPVDQAEELLSVEAGPQADQFLSLMAELVGLVNTGDLGLIIAATIRTDRYEAMQNHPALAGVATVLFDELKPMPATQFKEVIAGPAAQASAGAQRLSVAPDLVNRLLADAAEGADTLPLLALTLARLYADYASTGELTLAQYDVTGGMRHVVENAIDEALDPDPDQRDRQLQLLRSAFVPWLATVNPDNDQPLRRVARYSDLPPESRPLIDALVEKRLLVCDEHDGQKVIEVALESLLRQWGELAGWLREERQHLKSADDIERNAIAWATHEQDPAWLLTGTRLTDAETLAAASGFADRLAGSRDYLATSRDAENQRVAEEAEYRHAELRNSEQRREAAESYAADLRRRTYILRAVLAGMAVIALVAVIAFVQADHERRQATREARDALATQLDTQASTVFSPGVAAGDEIRGLAETLAAQRLRTDPAASQSAFYTATTALNTTRTIVPTPAALHVVAFSPDGRTLATGSVDHTVQLWNFSNPARPVPWGQPLTGHTDDVWSLAFSPDGHTMATGSGDHTVRLWNLRDPAHPAPWGPPLTGHTDTVESVAFSFDGHTLASGSGDRTVRLWDLADLARPTPLGQPLTGHTDYVSSVAFSPDRRTLASGSGDHTIRLWDVGDLAHPMLLGQPLIGHTDRVTEVAFGPDGHILASSSRDHTVRLWDLDDPVHPAPLAGPTVANADVVVSVAFSPDGRTLACGSRDATIALWDLSDPAHPALMGRPLVGHTSAVVKVAFSPDGHTLASGSRDTTVRLWNLDAARPLQGHTDAVQKVVFTQHGSTLASAGRDSTVRLWNLSDPTHPAPLGEPLAADAAVVGNVAFSPDGRTLASGDRTIRLWDVADPAHPVLLGAPLIGHTDYVSSVAFSPDGRTLASGSGDRTVRLWNVADPAHPAPLGAPLIGHTEEVTDVAFSPDGRTLASGSGDRTVRLWNVADPVHPAPVGQPLVGHTDTVVSVAFNPRGHTLVSGSFDHTIRLWNVSDPSRSAPLGQPLTGHANAVESVAFGLDGHTLASASNDHTIRLWNVSDPVHPAALGQPMTGHTDIVYSVAFSPDGRTLASGSHDGSVRLWPTPVEATVATLCSKMLTNISRQQWRDWISPNIGYLQLCPDLAVPQD